MSPRVHIHFPRPGNWAEYRIAAMWTDADGYACRRIYKPADLTTEQLAVLSTMISAVVGLGEPWSATHAVASVQRVEPTEGQTFSPYEVLDISVYASRDADGASRRFTSEDIPALRTEDADAISLFNTLVS